MRVLRKIGYSFVGPLAGSATLLAYFVLTTRAWEPNHWQPFDIFLLIMTFTLPGWIIIGVPAVLFIDVQFIRILHWLLVLLIGAALGAFALFLISLIFGLVHYINLGGHWGPWYWLAMLVSTVAFAVYSALARQTPSAQ